MIFSLEFLYNTYFIRMQLYPIFNDFVTSASWYTRLLRSICRVFSTISFKSSTISSDTGGRPDDLPLLIFPIVKNLFTIRPM
jgi:hypothetical protein